MIQIYWVLCQNLLRYITVSSKNHPSKTGDFEINIRTSLNFIDVLKLVQNRSEF